MEDEVTVLPRIVLIDDEEEFQAEWVSKIREAIPAGFADVVAPTKSEIEQAVAQLGDRRRGNFSGCDLVDCADILVVDADLRTLPGLLTGDMLSYIARCWSSCGPILELNYDRSPDHFDLSLEQDWNTWADQDVGASFLSLPSLWNGTTSMPGPWQWPGLLSEISRFRSRIKIASAWGDAGVLSSLGFSESERMLLSLKHFEQIAPTELPFGKDPTIDQVALASLAPKDTVALKGDRGALIRIGVARLTKWLRRLLASQELIVDGPHAATRVPRGLVGSPVATPGVADTLVSVDPLPAFDPTFAQLLRDCAVPNGELWFGRNVFWWQRARERPEFSDFIGSSGTEQVVFCEDTSRFSVASRAREFVADIAPSQARWVAGRDAAASELGLPGFDYRGEQRFLSV